MEQSGFGGFDLRVLAHWQKLREERHRVRQHMVALAAEVTRLEDEAPLFAARFWRELYGSLPTHTIRGAVTKLFVLTVGLFIIPHARAATQSHLDLVIALDLTQSVAVKGPDGTTEFQKNVDGVTHILAEIPAGCHLTVVGITDHSFAQPYILLSATAPEDPGYFGERLSAARKELVRTWKLRSAHFDPRFSSTDVLGALALAAQIFNQQPANGGERVLMLFSDMRNHTPDLNLESNSSGLIIGDASKESHLASADLHQVRVYAPGVDGTGRRATYWEALERLWRGYFRRSGAALNTFSVLRDVSAGTLN